MSKEDDQQQGDLIDAEIEEVDLSTAPGDQNELDVTERDFADFVANNAQTYFRKFRNFRINDPDRFAVSWNWSAFFFTYIWMAYRKMYGWAGIVFAAQSVITMALPPLDLLPMVALGVAGNYLYFRCARSKIVEVKTSHPFRTREELSVLLGRKGGVNPWMLALAIPFPLIEAILHSAGIF
jgi:Protein of unknown function (DUF2628)